jgi:flagellar basal body-associated protein FliL
MVAPARLIERTLVVVLVFLVVIIAVATLVFRGGREVAAEPDAVEPVAVAASFTGIGRLRAVMKAERGGDGPTVIVTVVFPYNAADTAFTEELEKNIGFFREAIGAYFAAMTAADPRLHDEAVMKAELLDRFNARLRLGTLDRLFFSEFLIID